jgi:hypothetical protein
MKTQASKLEHNAAAIKRWRSRLKRAMSMLDKLEKQRKRLEAKVIPSVYTKIVDKVVVNKEPVPALLLAAELASTDADLGIPSFLRRTPDPAVEAIKTEQAETKKKKAKGRIEKMKAKKRGDLKKMPLSGKAAMDLIDNG